MIGEVTDSGHMVLEFNGEVVCDIPLGPLADDAPCYERPYAIPKAPEPLTDIPESTDIAADLLKLMGSPALASRRWVWEQYDQSVGADTVQRPGGDAAVVRVHGSKKALAMTTDCTPRYCYADPVEGGKQAVAEAYRNLCAVGARPLAITNCLNFGNPQRPEIMGQFVGCVEGMAEACRALDFPVVSGNVSLYNETKNDDGSSLAILPTPAIGGVGLLDDWEKSATIGFKARRRAPRPDRPLQGPCRSVVMARGLPRPPRRCAAAGRSRGRTAAGECVRGLIADGLVTRGPRLLGRRRPGRRRRDGAGERHRRLDDRGRANPESRGAILFGEDQGRYVVATRDPDAVRAARQCGASCSPFRLARRAEMITFDLIGRGGRQSVTLADLRAAHEGFFPKLMGGELTPEF